MEIQKYGALFVMDTSEYVHIEIVFSILDKLKLGPTFVLLDWVFTYSRNVSFENILKMHYQNLFLKRVRALLFSRWTLDASPDQCKSYTSTSDENLVYQSTVISPRSPLIYA